MSTKPLQKNQVALYVAIGIFIVTISTLGAPFTHWGFLHDDFGVVYHAWVAGGTHLTELFTEGSMTAVVQPTNYIVPEQSFLAVLYRPLVYMFLHGQLLLCGINPYALFLITIIFHALNAVLLFYILLSFFKVWEALCATLLFTFHLSLWDWMGWIAGQNQVVNLTLFLLIIVSLKHYLDNNNNNKSWPLLASSLLYLVSLFYREELLIVPFWLCISIPLYMYYKNKRATWNVIAQTTFGFWLMIITYCGIRLYNFPFKTTGTGIKGTINPFTFLASLQYRFFDVVTFLSDIANLAWLPGGNRLLKGSLLGIFLLVIAWLFYKNKQKGLLLFLALSTVMFMWPALWRYYSSRFLYMGLPFLVCFLVILVTHYSYNNETAQRIWLKRMTVFCIMLSTLNLCALTLHTKTREAHLNTVNYAFQQLACNPQIKHKKPCFIGLPYNTFVTGVAQALYLNGFPRTTPIYYDNTTFFWTHGTINNTDIIVKKTDTGFILGSHCSTKAWLLITNSCMPLGTHTIVQTDSNKITNMTYKIDECYLSEEHVWITWDYEKEAFRIL